MISDKGFDSTTGDVTDASLLELDQILGGALTSLCKETDFKGKADSVCVMRIASLEGRSVPPMIILVGLGNSGFAAFDNSTWTRFGRKGAESIPFGKWEKVGVFVPGEHQPSTSNVQALFSSLLGNAYKDLSFKSCPGSFPPKQTVYHGIGFTEADETAITKANCIAAGIVATKNLVNAPANHATPTALADFALNLASLHSDVFQATILDRDNCASYGKCGMGLFLGVAQGSSEPPKFIHLVYNGNGAGSSCARTIGLVGKGVTFDSGGVNIKAGEGSMIELMKFDMGGAASVLGAAVALSKLRPKDVEVHFVIAACENMVDASAMRPGDVLEASDGTTVEINNTDAEGRLTLADALLYVHNETSCSEVMTIATLTGACIIALGEDMAGLLAKQDSAALAVESAARRAGEPVWRLPLHKPYRAGLDSIIADLKNTGPRPAGTITSALFLDEFASRKSRVEWAHLDIAGPVWDRERGATGFSVATLVEYCLSRG